MVTRVDKRRSPKLIQVLAKQAVGMVTRVLLKEEDKKK